MGARFPLKLPRSLGDLDLHLMHDSLGPSDPQPKRHLDQFSRFCTDDRRVSLYFTMGRPFSPPSKCPFSIGDVDLYLIHGYLGLPKSSTQMASRSVQPFLHGSLVTSDY